jgi:hypothetical protein
MEQKIKYDFPQYYDYLGLRLHEDVFLVMTEFYSSTLDDFFTDKIYLVNQSGEVLHTITETEGLQQFEIDEEGMFYSDDGYFLSGRNDKKHYLLRFPQTQLHKAVALASRCFLQKKDKGGAPYIFHLLSVMGKGQTEKEKITGVLHDLFEDCCLSDEEKQKIRADFGDEVFKAIQTLTLTYTEEEKTLINISSFIEAIKEDIETGCTDIERLERYKTFVREKWGNEMLDKAFATTCEALKTDIYMSYVKKVKTNELTRKVKIYDLENNLDISRIPHPTAKDFKRMDKYRKALFYLADKECMKERYYFVDKGKGYYAKEVYTTNDIIHRYSFINEKWDNNLFISTILQDYGWEINKEAFENGILEEQKIKNPQYKPVEMQK